jgi:hypothetical protein
MLEQLPGSIVDHLKKSLFETVGGSMRHPPIARDGRKPLTTGLSYPRRDRAPAHPSSSPYLERQ